ncbi:unnamed protein product [Closterium sp. NIES-53]
MWMTSSIFSPSSDLVKEVMLKLQDKFKCKALGDVSFYLGLHIERDVEKRCMGVHQRKYLEALAANFGQSEGHVATPFPSGFKCVKGPEEESVGEEERRRFHSLVGSLMYAAVNTRPDIAFATAQLAMVVQCPNEEHVAAGMRVAKYLGQTTTVGLQFSASAQRRQKGADGVEPGRLFLTTFSDASYASEPEEMTSVGGFICCVGGGPTAWESKKQVDQALSSVESEYMALFHAVRENVWQQRLLAELGEEQQGPTPLYCDSQGAIALAKNPVLHGLTKHMRQTSKNSRKNLLGEHEESGVATKKQHNDEKNLMAAAEEEYGENMWGTIASAAFSNPTSATGECDWLTLHRRMGHVALPILQQLVKNEMVAGIRVKGEPDEVLGCLTCMQAKFTRYPFSSSEATAKAPLDEVVMDVVGPLKLGATGAEYFLTIVDVYTRMTWVYVLSKKSDVAETVKTDWLPMVERQQDRLQRQGLHLPAAEEEGRGKRRIQAPNRLTYDALGRPAKSALAGAALIVGDDKESDYDECAFVFFSPVEMPGEPATLKEALESSDAEEWKKAMESELKSIEENGTCWLVAKGYQQKEKVDYKELFAPVVQPTTLRTLLAGAAIKGWVMKQMDMTTAFFNGVLEEETFMAQPEGFDDGSGRVLKLKNGLYEPKQAPRQW